MSSAHANPFLREAARRKENGDGAFTSNSWNGCSWNNRSGNSYNAQGVGSGVDQVKWIKVFKEQIVDGRCLKYDKRGRLLKLTDDQYTHVITFGTHLPAPHDQDLVKDGAVYPLLVTGHNRRAVSRITAEIIAPHISLDVTVQQARIIANVLDQTYKSLGIRKQSVHDVCVEAYGDYSRTVRPRLESRLLQGKLAKEKVESSDEDSDDDAAPAVPRSAASASNTAYIASLETATPTVHADQQLAPELQHGIQQLIQGFNGGTLQNPFATTPIKPKEKRLRVVNRDRIAGAVGMEGVDFGQPIHGAPPPPAEASQQPVPT